MAEVQHTTSNPLQAAETDESLDELSRSLKSSSTETGSGIGFCKSLRLRVGHARWQRRSQSDDAIKLRYVQLTQLHARLTNPRQSLLESLRATIRRARDLFFGLYVAASQDIRTSV